MVNRVQRDVDGAGIVRVCGLDICDEVLVEEQLSDVRNAATGDSTVTLERCIDVADNVNVSGAAAVVSRKDGAEGSDTVLIGLLQAAKSHVVKVRGIVAVSIAVVLHARIDTGGIAVPHVPVKLGNGLAGVDIDELSVHIVHDTRFVVDDVLTVVLALDPERANFTLRGEDAGLISSEESGDVGVRRDISGIGMVSCVENGVGIATGESTSLYIVRLEIRIAVI